VYWVLLFYFGVAFSVAGGFRRGSRRSRGVSGGGWFSEDICFQTLPTRFFFFFKKKTGE
jgi:hypothetical protein